MTNASSEHENEPRRRPARESTHNAEQRKVDAELAANPPKVVLERVRGSGGIYVARLVDDPMAEKPHRPRPECKCDLIGSSKRRPGHHHAEGCGRREPW